MAWRFAGLGRVSCAVSLVLLAACGGQARSSGADLGDSALAGSGPSTAGRGATLAGSASANTGGDAPNPASGEGRADAAAAGASPTINAACSALCDEGRDCPDGGGGFSLTCKNDCSTAVTLGSAECAALGVDMLSCLTSALRDKSHSCAGRFTLATQTCAASITSYQSCAATYGSGAPLAPILCVHLSLSSADGTLPTCVDDLKCLNGLINDLSCAATDDGHSLCACFSHFNRTDVTVSDPTLSVCSQRFDECLATGTLAP